MKRMEPLDSTPPNFNLISLMLSGISLALGYCIDRVEIFYVKHKAFFEFTKDCSADLAWWGASAVALVTVVTWLQNNGFLPKGKIKK